MKKSRKFPAQDLLLTSVEKFEVSEVSKKVTYDVVDDRTGPPISFDFVGDLSFLELN